MRAPSPLIPAPGLEQDGEPVYGGPVLPHHARRGTYVPVTGQFLTIDLPGEQTRARVEEVFGHNVVQVRLGIIMTRGSHEYKTNDPVAVERNFNGLSEIWTPISKRQTMEREAREAARLAAMEDEPEPEEDIALHAEIPPKPTVEVQPEAAPAESKKRRTRRKADV